jgi:hypothetical protein
MASGPENLPVAARDPVGGRVRASIGLFRSNASSPPVTGTD